jgi:RimJ/RimL family protein N-acetyltransferase
MRTRYTVGGRLIGIGEIDDLQGCSQIAVFHSAFVLPEHRNKQLGLDAHLSRIEEASAHGYNCAICTVDAKNAAQVAILEKAGWHKVWDFDSSKTGHVVEVYMREIA